MPSRADILGLHAILEGRLIVQIVQGEIWTSHGARAESLDKRTGYGRVHVAQRRPQSMAMAHRLVWIAAYGLIPDGLQINHINRCRWDNRIQNLELVTHGGNARHWMGYGYDAIGGNIDLGWLGRLDHGQPEPADEDNIEALMLKPPGPLRYSHSEGGAVARWEHFA